MGAFDKMLLKWNAWLQGCCGYIFTARGLERGCHLSFAALMACDHRGHLAVAIFRGELHHPSAYLYVLNHGCSRLKLCRSGGNRGRLEGMHQTELEEADAARSSSLECEGIFQITCVSG